LASTVTPKDTVQDSNRYTANLAALVHRLAACGMGRVVLSAEQIQQFRTFGCLPLRGVLRPDELARLAAEHAQELERAFADMPFDGTRRHTALFTTPRTPCYAALLEDERFLGPAQQLYGEDVLGIACDGTRFTGDTYWHPDTAAFDNYGLKYIFYFDRLRADNGALRVLPGSHRRPLFDEVQEMTGRVGQFVDLPGYVFECAPGDVCAIDLRTWHASFGGPAGRRGGSIFYFHNPATAAEIAAVHEQDRLIRLHARELLEADRSNDKAETTSLPHNPAFDRYWLENPDNHPVRARWIARLRELGFLDPIDLPQQPTHLMPHRRPA